MTTSRRDARDGAFRRAPKLETREQAAEHFGKNSRVRSHDTGKSVNNSVSWNCDGTRIATASQDGYVCIGSVDSGFRVKNMFVGNGHSDQVYTVSFHPTNPSLCVSVSVDRVVNLWDIRASKNPTRLHTKTGNLTCAWSPCGRFLTYTDKDDKIHLIDGRSLSQVKPAYDAKNNIGDISYDTTGNFLFVAAGGGKVEILSMPDLKPVRTVQAHSSASSCVALTLSRDGKRMAVGANDAVVSVWDVEELICERTMNRMDWPVRSLSFSHDGRLLASASEDHHIDFSWINDGERVFEHKIDTDAFCISWHPSQYILAMTLNEKNNRDKAKTNLRLFGLHS